MSRYRVMFFTPESPLHLAGWLHDFCEEEKVELVTATGQYFIFQPMVSDAKALIHALKIASEDMHPTSTRPCGTCRLVSNVLGEPFGCYEYQENRKRT